MESFNACVKRELCRVAIRGDCCTAAEVYGALLLGNTFSDSECKIVTTHEAFAGRMNALLSAAFNCVFSVRHGGEGRAHILTLTEPQLVKRVREHFGYSAENSLVLHLNNGALEQECCQKAFWRGAFLSGGTITTPEKQIRLELVTPHRHLARELPALLRESGLEPRCTARAGTQVLYFKQAEAAIDFIALCGAPQSARTVLRTKQEKELRNNINRRVNCDSYNVDKTVAAVERQCRAIRRLSAADRLDSLPEALKETARMRLEYPEDSLAQLAVRLAIGKSGLNHRLRKLMEMSAALDAEGSEG